MADPGPIILRKEEERMIEQGSKGIRRVIVVGVVVAVLVCCHQSTTRMADSENRRCDHLEVIVDDVDEGLHHRGNSFLNRRRGG